MRNGRLVRYLANRDDQLGYAGELRGVEEAEGDLRSASVFILRGQVQQGRGGINSLDNQSDRGHMGRRRGRWSKLDHP